MKFFQTSGLLAGVVVAAGLTACSKPEQAAAPAAAPVATAPAPVPTVVVASKPEPTPVPVVVATATATATPTATPVPIKAITAPTETITALKTPKTEASAFSLESFKLPDFQSASVDQLATTASQVLTGLGDMSGKSTPSALAQIDAVKTSLSAGKALEALSALSKLGDTVKAIPGAEGVLTIGKQVVSAWALKQGFDPAKISGVLGSLQKGDWLGLAAQAATLVGKGGVSGEQKGLLNGVLGVFGQSGGTASAASSALKGLLGK
jgi:hypothetical protein